MVFLPRTDLGAQERCRTIVESEILRFGYTIYGWRQVPVDIAVIGEKANATRPEIEQIMIAQLPRARRGARSSAISISSAAASRSRRCAEQINDFYICSLSCRSLIYKGMFLAEQLDGVLSRPAGRALRLDFAIFHQRYSTNTFPTWRLAQPFRMLAHNGEINTLHGNINWMKSHETRMARRRVRRRTWTTSSRSSSRAARTPPRSTPSSRCWSRAAARADGQDAADPRSLGEVATPCRERTATCTPTATR